MYGEFTILRLFIRIFFILTSSILLFSFIFFMFTIWIYFVIFFSWTNF